MNRSLRTWIWLPVIAALVVILDQWTKNWIRQHIAFNALWAPIPALEPWFKITHLTNTGAAFGILQGQGWLFILIPVVVITAVILYARHLPMDSWIVRLCLGLQLGGALGNLVDRIQFGHVTDFLLFTLPLRDRELQWPAFNVADSSIVVGVIVLAFLLLREEKPIAEQAVTRTGEP